MTFNLCNDRQRMGVAHALARRARVEPERYKEIVRLTSEEVMTVAFLFHYPIPVMSYFN